MILFLTAFAADLSLPASSPHAAVTQTVGTVEITVDYSSPRTNERTIWGELVPYGELWRTGANGATTIELGGDATIGGTLVEAGKYAVFSKPGEDSWTVMINSNPDQGGTRMYDEALNVASFDVKPVKVDARERLTFLFVDTDEDSTTLHLEWAGVAVPITIEVDSAGRAQASIDAYVASGETDKLASAARYQTEQGKHDEALALIEKALDAEETWYATWIKATALAGKGDKKNAYKALKTAMKLGTSDEDGFFFKDRVEEALKTWPKK